MLGPAQPAIESEDDLEVRAAPFYWLDEADRGARFPNTLRQVPMIWGEGARYGWFQWKQSQSGKDGHSPAEIEKAIEATPREHCKAMVEDLDEIWQELDILAKELNGQMGHTPRRSRACARPWANAGAWPSRSSSARERTCRSDDGGEGGKAGEETGPATRRGIVRRPAG